MEEFKVKKKHLTGEIADFPKYVVQAMVDEQVRQGNPADPSVFAKRDNADKYNGGFDWCYSTLGTDIWNRVISLKQFDLIPEPESEPESEKPKGHVHAKLMKQYAKDAKTSETPWELWEFRDYDDESWRSLGAHPYWGEKVQYRRKSDEQVESKEPPTPHEIIQAMLAKGMTVWAGISDYSYEEAREQARKDVHRVTAYFVNSDSPVRTGVDSWEYAVPIDTTTMTEITEMPK